MNVVIILKILIVLVGCSFANAGTCTSSQILFNGQCYGLSELDSATDEVTFDLPANDFYFLMITPSYYKDNPAYQQFEFLTTSGQPSSCSLNFQVLQACDSSCDFSTLNAGYYLASIQGNSYNYNPLIANQNSSTTCGCPELNRNQDNTTVWYLRVQNTDVSTCTLKSISYSSDVCSEGGDLVSGSELSPPQTGQPYYCVCRDPYAGDKCNGEIGNYADDNLVYIVANSEAYMKFTPTRDQGFFTTTFSMTTSSAIECKSSPIYITYTCGECTIPYPFDISPGVVYSMYNMTASANWTLSDFEDNRQACGCSDTGAAGATWYLRFDNRNIATTCIYYMNAWYLPTCAAPGEDQCSGFGSCSDSFCDCPEDRSLLNCKKATKKPIEQYNGLPYAKEIPPKGNELFRSYVLLSPFTNRQVSAKLRLNSGTLSSILGKSTTQNKTSSLSVTLLASFDEEPQVNLSFSPKSFPSVMVHVVNFTADFNRTLTEKEVEIVIPIDKQTKNKLHLCVVPSGSFDAETSELSESDVKLLLSIKIEDRYAPYVDIFLMIFFGLLVLFFCVAWKACPMCFHGTMKRIIPELYVMELRKREQHKLDRQYLSKEVAEAMTQVVKFVSLLEMLKMVNLMDLPKLKLPKIPKPVNLEKVIVGLEDLCASVNLPNIHIDAIPSPLPLRVALAQIKATIPDLTIPVDIPKKALPTDLLTALLNHVPDIPDFQIHVTSLPKVMMHLRVRFPTVNVIKELQMMLDKIPAASLPMIPVPEHPDVTDFLRSFVAHLGSIPNIPAEFPLKVKLEELISIKDINLNVDASAFLHPVTVPVSIKDITLQKLDWRVLTSVHFMEVPKIEVDVRHIGSCEAGFKIILGLILILLRSIGYIVVEMLTLMFNVAIIHSAFFDVGYFKDILPDLTEIKVAFANLFGDFFSEWLYIIEKIFRKINFMVVFESWSMYLIILNSPADCGGTLTMVAPFVFLFGAFLTWIVLEKDLILYLGIKMRIHHVKPGTSTLARYMWLAITQITVKVTILTLQAVIFVLAQAITTSTTSRTCNYIDLTANTFGKVIVAFFYVFFYVMFFFIFTGAPDWPKYAHLSTLPTILLVFWDGVSRFAELTTGVWTDATVKAFNVIGRAHRYDTDLTASLNSKLNMMGMETLDSARQTQELRDSLHEQIMYIIAVSRTVVWIPLPLCVVVAKFSEALNQVHVFVFTKKEPLKMRRAFGLRLFIWVFHFIQLPLVLGVVFTASTKIAALLSSTLIPLTLVKMISNILSLVRRVRASMEGADDVELEDL